MNDTNTMNLFEIRDYINKLEKRIISLEGTVNSFMEKYGPDVQNKRAQRDAVWDEMVRVVSIQNKNK
jgi:hypothetical protein|tara:strand:- start:254 stop:454 length:201 start_codon:yes stop_codon:yes gene_type:complete